MYENMEVELHHFLPRHYVGVSDQLHAFAD
jgi:hypothetical protein